MQKTALLAWLLVAVLQTACGGGGGKVRRSCEATDDCGAAQTCFEQECWTACTQPADCLVDEVCVRKTSGATRADVCETASAFAGCTGDDTCVSLVPGPCGLPPACDLGTGTCAVPPAPDGQSCELAEGAGRCRAGVCDSDAGPVEADDVAEAADAARPDAPGKPDAASDALPDAPDSDGPDAGRPDAAGTDASDAAPPADASDAAADTPAPDACVPDCLFKECGDDKCLGWCGECAAPTLCYYGICQGFPLAAPHFAGTYDVNTDLDLLTGLPPAGRAAVDLLNAALVDPSTALLLHSCRMTGSPAALALCDQAFADPGAPSIDTFTPLGLAVRDHVRAYLAGLAPEWQPGGVQGLGAALDTALGAVRLLATFGMGSDPDGNGNVATSGADWDRASLRWPFRVACDPTDDACGRLPVSLTDLGTGKLGQAFDASAGMDALGWNLDVKAHTTTLWLGKIVAWLYWGNVLPEVYGDGADGQPYVDGWTKLVRSVLAGQRACLDVGTCCELFANAIVDVEPSATLSMLLDACEALSAEDPVLTVGEIDHTQGNLTLTSDPAVTCRFADRDADGTTDAFGLPNPPSSRCAWWFFWSAGTAVSVPNTFWAVPSGATP